MRLLYDTKGRFRLHAIRDEEAKVGHIKQEFDIPLSEKKRGQILFLGTSVYLYH